jgi:linoleoyl-CoA desaturase
VGAHAEAWKQRHINSHHYAPNVEDYDSDLKITKLIRVIPDSGYFWYHKYQHIYAPFIYTTYSLFWIFIKDFVILFSKSENKERKGIKYFLSFFLQKSFYLTYILFLPLLFSYQDWIIILVGFLLMHLIQSLFLLFTFFMTHHVEKTEYPTTDENGYINTSWLMNQIKSSNDMHPFSEIANFILGGFNNHIAHHLFPHYHHIHYPELNRILYLTLTNNNIVPNRTTYWGGIISHLKLLKRMGYAETKNPSITLAN